MRLVVRSGLRLALALDCALLHFLQMFFVGE
jgi:hypothetical protein